MNVRPTWRQRAVWTAVLGIGVVVAIGRSGGLELGSVRPGTEVDVAARVASSGTADAASALALASGLAAPLPALQAALRDDESTRAAEGFTEESGRLVSPGERALRRDPVHALVATLPAHADGAFAVSVGGQPKLGVEFRHDAAAHAPREHASGVAVYRGIGRGTDLLVRAQADAVQALYLLHSAEASKVVRWTLDRGERVTSVREDGEGGLTMRSPQGDELLHLPAGVAFDADGHQLPVLARYDEAADAVEYRVVGEPTRYPVLVDPVIESPLWELAGEHLARMGHAMAYDPLHQQVVLFSGTRFSTLEGDTWTWDGTRWTFQLTMGRPLGRRGAVMVWDDARERIVLFGGESIAPPAFFDDTWTWDGFDWTRMVTPVRPSARSGAVAAYDSARAEVVLFGGQSRDDTWVWDGSSWTQRTPAQHPSARSEATLTEDPVAGNLVLFGGSDGTSRLAETWLWDGTTWTQASPAAAPPARTAHASAYDRNRNAVVVFGGYTNLPANDLWAFSGGTWTQVPTTSNPSERYYTGLAYDDTRSELVLFGGRVFGAYGSDTHVLGAGNAWTPRTYAVNPSARRGAALADDETNLELVLFGGTDGTTTFGDTWTYGPSSGWTLEAPTNTPPARAHADAVYSPNANAVVLFGGANGAGTALADTWQWDGSDWRQVAIGAGPPARSLHAMALERDTGDIVLFGGRAGTSELSDTHIYDGTSWTAVTTTTEPPKRAGHGMDYDEGASAMVLYGGGEDPLGARTVTYDDVWQFAAGNWTLVPTSGATTPGARAGAAVMFDRSYRRMVIHGGRTDTGLVLGDTFTLESGVFTQLADGSRDPARAFGGSSYFLGREALVVTGGLDASGLRTDTRMFRRTTLENGSDCSSDLQCRSGACIDGVCCNTACGEGQLDCMGCSNALTGQPSGTCAPLVTALAQTIVCRAANGVCDTAETCSNLQTSCPRDVFAYGNVECRPSVGVCDRPEACDGTSAACPADTRFGPATVCRDLAGPCDVEETCDGTSTTCPADRFATAGVCRAAASVCDAEDSCDGSGAACPADAAQPEGTLCAADSRSCGADSTCAGTVGATASCVDNHAPAGTPCATASCTDGVLYEAATCSGVSDTCTVSTTSCGGYACDGAACGTSCVDGGDCTIGFRCDTAGQCVPYLSNGTACTDSSECASFQCVDGVCCDRACDGTCEACNELGSVGTCVGVVGAPRVGHGSCIDAADGCGGSCDGSGPGCSYPGQDVTCRATVCAAGELTPEARCNGAGACPSPNPVSCGAPGCLLDGTDCAECSGSGECAPGDECVGQVCVPGMDAGVPSDGGLDVDGSVPSDGGLDVDGSVPSDGGLDVDAGADAGLDGGTNADGGTNTDAGVGVDGGSTARSARGCSCAVEGEQPDDGRGLLGVLAALAFVGRHVRSRRRLAA